MLALCTKGKARHSSSSTARTLKMKPNTLERKKISRPPHAIMFCLSGAPCTGQKRRKSKHQSFCLSLVHRPPLSRPPRHRFGPGKAFLTLCHSEPRRPPRLKPGSHHGRRSLAPQCWCSDCVALSLNFSLVAKISTA